MRQDNLLHEFNNLPPKAQKQVAEFIAFLQTRYEPAKNKKAKRILLSAEPFIGIWRDREDLSDSAAWIRKVRQGEWENKG